MQHATHYPPADPNVYEAVITRSVCVDFEARTDSLLLTLVFSFRRHVCQVLFVSGFLGQV